MGHADPPKLNFQLLQMVVDIHKSFHLSFILKQLGLVFAFQGYGSVIQ